MTKEEFAAKITGREYGEEITRAEAAEAKAAGLLVVYGASDDLIEFDGLFREELGAWGGETAFVTKTGAVDHYEGEDGMAQIEAVWGADGYSWTFKTDIPHATFEVMEVGEPYCRGIIIHRDDLL